MPHMTQTFHNDANGCKKPERYLDKQYYHPKTGRLYKVISFSIDAQRELWLLHYVRVGATQGDNFTFTHTITEFTRDGRFLEVL